MQRTAVVPLLLPNGSLVQVEVRSPTESDINAFEGIPEPLSSEFIQATLRGVAEMIAKGFEKVTPNKIVAEFGLELALESGKLTSMLVRGASKGTLKISLEWSPVQPPSRHD